MEPASSQPRDHQPRHPRYDAIHRALLTGLLSNVGTKTDTHEYLAPRAIRFSIFPGSALFGQKQKWLMAAELVGTKVYSAGETFDGTAGTDNAVNSGTETFINKRCCRKRVAQL